MPLQSAIFLARPILSGKKKDDDLVDKLHYQYTFALLLALSSIVSYKQYSGKPLECMAPDQFTSGWEEYAENYCWAEDTYFVKMDKVSDEIHSTRKPFAVKNTATSGKMSDRREKEKISYYKWVPFFLVIQSCTFGLPLTFWKVYNYHSGFQISDIVKYSANCRSLSNKQQSETLDTLTTHLENTLKFQRRVRRRRLKPHKYLLFLNLPYYSSYVTTIYLLSKVLYAINVALQFWAMNWFLNAPVYIFYGYGALRDVLNGVAWQNSGFFPRVTMCDFQVRMMGQVNSFKVQCVLTLNLFTEKIFIFLWFWYSALFLLTVLNLLHWCLLIMLPWSAEQFVERQLEISEMPYDKQENRPDMQRFVHRYLGWDGVFLIRVVSNHAGKILSSQLTSTLYRRFYGIEPQQLARTDSQWPAERSNDDVDTTGDVNALRNRRVFQTVASATPQVAVAVNYSYKKSNPSSTLPQSNKKRQDASPSAPADFNTSRLQANKSARDCELDNRYAKAMAKANNLSLSQLPPPPTIRLQRFDSDKSLDKNLCFGSNTAGYYSNHQPINSSRTDDNVYFSAQGPSHSRRSRSSIRI